MRGLLVRVGIDSTDGLWNAPVNPASLQFAFVTITETKALRPGLARYYDGFIPALRPLGVSLPERLLGQPTHLDPDFDHLTYGDQGQRGRTVSTLRPGDLLVFFAALRATDPAVKWLVYAIIGIYMIDQIASAASIARKHWPENAHTRRVPGPTDIVVRARPGVSGRLKKCIPIGEYRNRAYRVRRDLLYKWGGLNVMDGYVQRSAKLPELRDAQRFYRWFMGQNPQVVAANNPEL